MSHPIINGLATYGIIRTYNKGYPILAFIITLLFTIGPVGMLFWIILALTVFKPVLIALCMWASAMLVFAVVSLKTGFTEVGIICAVVTVFTELTLAIIHYA